MNDQTASNANAPQMPSEQDVSSTETHPGSQVSPTATSEEEKLQGKVHNSHASKNGDEEKMIHHKEDFEKKPDEKSDEETSNDDEEAHW